MELTFRVMSALCLTVQIGITSQPRETATPLQVQPAIGPEIIRAAHTIMEQATPFIQVHEEDSIITTAMGIRHIFPNVQDGNNNRKHRVGS